MAHSKKFKEEKTSTERSNCFSEEFVIPIGGVTDFYRAVSMLNAELGHGNWTTEGRPLRKIRRVDHANRIIFIGKKRTTDVVFRVPSSHESIASRLLLELSR